MKDILSYFCSLLAVSEGVVGIMFVPMRGEHAILTRRHRTELSGEKMDVI